MCAFLQAHGQFLNQADKGCVLLDVSHMPLAILERLGESGATHDSQSASRSGVEAWVAQNLNGWDYSDAGLSQGWVRCPSGLASLHHSRLSTRSPYHLYSFSGNRRFCYDNHGSFVYDSPNLFWGPSGSVRTGLTGVRSEPGHRTHLTSLLTSVFSYSWSSKKKRVSLRVRPGLLSSPITTIKRRAVIPSTGSLFSLLFLF